MRSFLKKNYKKLTEIFFKCLYGNISIDNNNNSKLISKIKITKKIFKKKKLLYILNKKWISFY